MGSAMPRGGPKVSPTVVRAGIGSIFLGVTALLLWPALISWWTSLHPPAPVAGSVAGSLLYVRDNGLWIRDLATGSERSFATFGDGAFGSAPASSPDGTHIAYTQTPQTGTNATTDLYVMSDTGSDRHLVRPNVVAGETPAWSADGSQLFVTVSVGDRSEQVQRVSIDGETSAPVVSGRSPSVSADGRLIAYVASEAGGTVGLWVSNTDGSEPRRLAGGPEFQDVVGPRFDASTDRIAFSAVVPSNELVTSQSSPLLIALFQPTAWAHGTPYDIWSILPDGSGLGRMSQIQDQIAYPSWSPDGRWLAATGDPGLDLIIADGSRRAWLLNQDALSAGLAWLRQ